MTTPAELLAQFLQEKETFTVKRKSSAEDIENILAMSDMLKLLERAYALGYDKGEESEYERWCM